jgi:putative transposase
MFTPSEFEHWCHDLQLAPSTCEVITAIRAAPPARRVTSRVHNVSGAYPSRKMGVTIQFESHTVELWAIYLMEHDPDVLEFYDQPQTFKLRYQAKSGQKMLGHYYTPDFLVLRRHGVGFEEWKTEDDLGRLAERQPFRYQRRADGAWRCPPGEVYAESLGLSFRVCSSASLPRTYIENLVFLEDYVGFMPTVPPQVQAHILERVRETPGIPLAAVIGDGSGLRANDVYAMLAQDRLYTDLYAVHLMQHWRVPLYLDQTQAAAYAHLLPVRLTEPGRAPWPDHEAALAPHVTLLWDGRPWTVVNPGETTITLLPETGLPMPVPSAFLLHLLDTGTITVLRAPAALATHPDIERLMAEASPTNQRTANERFRVVQAYLEHRAEIYTGTPMRTLRRWVRAFQQAQDRYGCGYVGLLPHIAQRGNRTPKAPPAARALMDTFIAERFETPRHAPAASVYRAYVQECTTRQLTPLTARAFYYRIKQRSGPQQTAQRSGARAAYQETPWVWAVEDMTPRHGRRPFEVVHIDHTPLDIALRCSSTGTQLGTPWATFMTDAYSRRLLAVYLTFDAPSYRSVMMVVRICVQRFGRFPQILVVDGGREFNNVYFDTLLARYHGTRKTRPVAKPRYGSVIERLFDTTNKEFLFNLLGNTQAAKQRRLLTKAVDPKTHAVWTLGDLYTYLTEWAYQIYDQNEHSGIGQPPRDAYLWGMQHGGEREHRQIPYDEAFVRDTCPSTTKGTAKVQPGSGIKVHYFSYWHNDFRNPDVVKMSVPVRYDPFDLGVVYAYVQGQWLVCRSPYHPLLEGRTEKELLVATAEMRRRARRDQTKTDLSAARLAAFITSAQAHEELLRQRWRDLEGHQVLEIIARMAPVGVPSAALPSETTRTVAPPPEEVAARIAPVDLTTLPVLGDYR